MKKQFALVLIFGCWLASSNLNAQSGNRSKGELFSSVSGMCYPTYKDQEWRLKCRPFHGFRSKALDILAGGNFKSGSRYRSGGRPNDLAIVSSKIYAQFNWNKMHDRFASIYGLRILLNRYQVSPKLEPIQLRSRSLFFIQPTITMKHGVLPNQALEIECQAGLHIVPNAEMEKKVEQIAENANHRILGKLGWIGKVAFKLNLHQFRTKHFRNLS